MPTTSKNSNPAKEEELFPEARQAEEPPSSKEESPPSDTKKKSSAKTPSQGDMLSIGKVLCRARRERRLTLAQISKELNIRQDILTALEEEDFASLHPAYIQGFVRSYSIHLELDPDAMLKTLQATGRLPRSTQYNIPDTIENDIMPTRTLLVWTGAILLILLMAWGGWVASRRPVSIAPPVVVTEPEAPTPATQTPPAEAKASQPAPAPQPAALAVPNVTLTATDSVWVQVREAVSGNVLHDKIMKPEESLTLETPTGTVADIGKASALRIYLGETPLPPTWAGGKEVLKEFSLTPEALEKFLPPAATETVPQEAPTQ